MTTDTPIENPRNLGPSSTAWLAAIGVHTKCDLQRLGPVLVYRLVKQRQPKTSLNLLWATGTANHNVRSALVKLGLGDADGGIEIVFGHARFPTFDHIRKEGRISEPVEDLNGGIWLATDHMLEDIRKRFGREVLLLPVCEAVEANQQVVRFLG